MQSNYGHAAKRNFQARYMELRLKTAAVTDLCTILDWIDSMHLHPYVEAVHIQQPSRYFALA
jgi:hypothetical protein